MLIALRHKNIRHYIIYLFNKLLRNLTAVYIFLHHETDHIHTKPTQPARIRKEFKEICILMGRLVLQTVE